MTVSEPVSLRELLIAGIDIAERGGDQVNDENRNLIIVASTMSQKAYGSACKSND